MGLKVRELMTEKVYSIQPDEDLSRLVELMGDLHIRHVPVVDDEGDVIGLVSHRDLLKSVLYAADEISYSDMREALQEIPVSDVMIPDVETIEPDASIEEAGNIMIDNKMGCLPVVENDKLVGILTESDFVKYVVGEELAEVSEGA